VPAAAVTQVVQTLIRRIWCKGYVGGLGLDGIAQFLRLLGHFIKYYGK